MPKSRRRRRPTSRRHPRTTRPPVVGRQVPGFRGRAESTSAPVLQWISSKPLFFLPLLTGVLLVVGLSAPAPVGGPLLLLLAALVGWLSYLSWPVVRGVQRVLRLVTTVALATAAVGRLVA